MDGRGHVSQDTTYYASALNPVDYENNPGANPPTMAHRGWYLHLPLAGQRVLQNTIALGNAYILIPSTIPAEAVASTRTSARGESCDHVLRAARFFYSVLDPFTGHPPKTPIFRIDPGTNIAPNVVTSLSTVESKTGMPAFFQTVGGTVVVNTNCQADQSCASVVFEQPSIPGRRVNWMHIQ